MDFDWDDDDGNEYEDDFEIEENMEGYKPTYVLLAIDVGPTMFVKNGNGESPFLSCIKGLLLIMDKMLVKDSTSLKSPLGIVLATNDDENFHFIKFSDNMVKNYALLKEVASKDNEELKNTYQRSGSLELDKFFTQCQKCLVEVNADVYKRNIIFITNDDNPKIADDVKFRALNIAKSFLSHKLYLEVNTFDHSFDYDAFYVEVLKESGSMVKREYLMDDIAFACKVNELLVLRLVKKMVKFYPKLDDLTQYLELYQHHYVKDTDIRNNFAVTSDKAEPVVKHRCLDEDDKGDGMLKAYYDKNNYLEVSKAEKEILKETDLPKGYTFLYVDVRKSKFGQYYEKPFFLEVNPKKPNRQFFLPFWEYCYNKARVLVCARKYLSEIRYVELIPSVINKTRMFMGIVLPTSDDRNYTYVLAPKPIEAGFGMVNKLSQVVENMSADYQSSDFYNVALRRKMAYIRSKLTDENYKKIPLMKWEHKYEETEFSDTFAGKRKAESEDEDDYNQWVGGNITGCVPQKPMEKPPPKKRAPPKKKAPRNGE